MVDINFNTNVKVCLQFELVFGLQVRADKTIKSEVFYGYILNLKKISILWLA